MATSSVGAIVQVRLSWERDAIRREVAARTGRNSHLLERWRVPDEA
jgi:hypothetical protein